jgi:co-chaperonin GroES (HSP10)
MKPLRDLIFIQLDDESNQTASGLYLVKTWDTLPPTGTVTAVGPDVKDVSVGDHVIFMNYASIDTDKADIRIVKEEHVLGVIDDKE